MDSFFSLFTDNTNEYHRFLSAEDSESSSDGPNLWWVGVILIICGCISVNAGNNIMSIGHRQNREFKFQLELEALELEASKKKNESPPVNGAGGSNSDMNMDVHDTLTILREEAKDLPKYDKPPGTLKIGVIIFLAGSVLTFAAFGFAAQSLLATLESVQFVTNVMFAKYVLKEDIGFRQYAGTVMILAGNGMTVAFGTHTSHQYDSEEMIALFSTKGIGFIIYCIVAAGGFFIAQSTHIKLKLDRIPKVSDKIENNEAFDVEKTTHSTTHVKDASMLEMVSFSLSSTIVGTLSILFAKCLSELLILTMGGENQFGSWFTYVVFFSWLVTATFWILRMNEGLACYKPLIIIPVLQVCFTFFAIICGGLYFHEFYTYSIGQFFGFFAGCGVMFYGVYMLTPKNDTEGENEDGTEGGDGDRRQATVHDLSAELEKYKLTMNPLPTEPGDIPLSSGSRLSTGKNSLHKRGSTAECQMARSMGSVGYAFGMSTALGQDDPEFGSIYG